MATAPYGVRLLVGAAVTALEETRKLPQTILMYPMTVASTVAHIVMKMQQDLADLVIKGDAALENIFPPKDEQPEWATFDEDLAGDDDDAPAAQRRAPHRGPVRAVHGRPTASRHSRQGSEPVTRPAARRPPRRRRRSPRSSTTSR